VNPLSPSRLFLEEEIRPHEQLSSESSRIQATVSAYDLGVSQWGTVLTFVLGDLVGLLSVLGFVVLGASVFEPALAVTAYEASWIVLPGGLLVYALAGLYQRRFAHPALEMQRIGSFTVLTGLVAGVTLYGATGAAAPALMLAAGGGVGAVVMPVCRALFRILFARTRWWGFPAVVVSSGGRGGGILSTLNRWPEIGIRPAALLSDTPFDDAPLQDPAGPDPAGPDPATDVPLRGGYEMAPYLARTFDIPYAIVAMPTLTHESRTNLLAHYSKFFDHVFVVPDPKGPPALWTTGRSGDGLFGYGVRNVALRPGAQFIKRAVDIVGALCALVLCAPLMAGIALLIRMDAPGAVFYRQERMGREGRIVTILKFRTMYEDADERLAGLLRDDPALREEYERYHKLKNDPRVTRVGKLLRRYSLDELPQILNVLRGDMSLVGPRAYMPSELAKMNGMARAVLQSAPGITGLWQVSGRNHLSFASRVNLDVHYIQNWSPWLDLYLLVRTGPVVLSGEGAS
jgi:Undecaprenyl-phosphate galactose phosphotransferase WbaP